MTKFETTYQMKSDFGVLCWLEMFRLVGSGLGMGDLHGMPVLTEWKAGRLWIDKQWPGEDRSQ